LLAKIQEKQQNQNVQLNGIEQRLPDPTVNVVTYSGAVTGGQPMKSNRSWVRKAEDKQPAIDLSKIKETFVNASKEFCMPNPPSSKGKELEVIDRSMELHSDEKASTSVAACREIEPASNIKSFLQGRLKLIRDENAQLEIQRLIDYCDPATMERVVNQVKIYFQIGREMRLSVVIGSYKMDEVVLDLGSEVNVMTKQTWEIMAKLKLAFSPIQLRLENQQRVIPLGRLSSVPIDLDGVRNLVDFEVIEIIDDSTPYPALLGIDWEFDNQAIINLKKKTMSFKGNGIRVIGPLDPTLGPRYTKLITAEEEARNIDVVYQLTTAQGDYVNPTNDGMVSWCCESSCVSNSEVGLKN